MKKCSYLRSSCIRETPQVVFSFRYLNIQLKPAITTSKRTAKKCRYKQIVITPEEILRVEILSEPTKMCC